MRSARPLLTTVKRYLAIPVYRCLVAGEPSPSVDVRVRYFEADSEDDVRSLLRAETPDRYLNHLSERVEWRLLDIMAIEAIDDAAAWTSGDELIGFITEASELHGKGPG